MKAGEMIEDCNPLAGEVLGVEARPKRTGRCFHARATGRQVSLKEVRLLPAGTDFLDHERPAHNQGKLQGRTEIPTARRDAGGSRTHSKLLCRQPPYRLAPAPSHSVSSPGVEPGLRPSQGRVRSATLRGHVSFQRPAEESNRGTRAAGSGSFEDCHAIRYTRRAFIQVSRPGIEPGSGPSEGPMRSLAPSRRSASRPGVEPGPGP